MWHKNVILERFQSSVKTGHRQLDVIYLDMSKAFDKVSHELLKNKL